MSLAKHVLVVCCLVRNHKDEILLVRHHLRGWELPQGRVEQGEALMFALSREVLEETGVTIQNPKPAVVWSKVSDPFSLIFCFVADYSSGALTPSEETPQVEWCHADEVLERVQHPVNRDRYKSLLENEGTVQMRSYATGPYRVLS